MLIKSKRKYGKPDTRVLFVSPFPPPPAGVSNVTAAWFDSNLAKRFDMQLCDITRRRVSLSQRSQLNLSNLIDNLKAWVKFIRMSVSFRPQIVNVIYTSRFAVFKASGFAFLGKLLGAKIVGHLHGGDFDKFYQELSSLGKVLVQIGLRIPHYWIVPGLKWRTVLTECGVTYESLTVCHNPVRLEVFDFAKRLQERGGVLREHHPLEVLFVGAICRRKGFDEMLQVLKWVEKDELPVHFTFIGGEEVGGERAEIIQAFGELISPDQHAFLQPMRVKETLRLVGDCDVFWLPSLNENLPIALLDAMTLGRPVIATRVGAVPEVFENGESGFLVEPGDPKQLYEALKKMVEFSDMRKRFSLNNFKVSAECFHPNILAECLAGVYRSCIGED